MLPGQKCSGVGGRESGDLELHLMRVCGYDKLTLLGLDEEAVCAELLEDFLDMLLVGSHVSGVDEDVVQVY